jgi:ABC-type lipoprotein export system ATPase subunit
MPLAHLVRSVPVERTPRVLQLEGLFEVPPTQRSEQSWQIELPLEAHDWNIGLIVGPSGSGKSTVARELFGQHIVGGFDWPTTRSIVDGFPARLSIKEITGLLSSVGFSSPPAWLRPFGCLSNGEQFRATLARALAECDGLAVIDEFTSVVDRQVAQIGSAAVARAIRTRGSQFLAVTCHYDVTDWLQPDWVLEMPVGAFSWRCLRRRPSIALTVRRVHPEAWQLFKHHHYLDTHLNHSARCFVAWVGERPAAFASAIYMPHPTRHGWREHRTVCLPDFQGVGIGNALSEFVAGLFVASGRPYYSVTSSPAMIRHRARSPLWHMHRTPARTSGKQPMRGLNRSAAVNRLVAGFRFVGPPRREEARHFGLV